MKVVSKYTFPRNSQFYKFSLYGFLKNLKFFDPFIILFFREMGLSFLEIGTLFSIREITTNVFEIPTGVIADTYGRRISMIFSFISYIFSFLLFYFFPGFGIYAAAMVFFAGGEAFRTGTHKAMILEYLKINNLLQFKVDYYGHTRGWSQFGSAVSSLIAAALVFYSGSYKIIFLSSTIPYVFALFLMISYPKELDGDIAHGKENGTLSKTKKQIMVTLGGFASLFKSRGTLRGLFNSSFFDAVFKTIKDYLQPVIRQYALLLPLFIALEEDKRVSVIIGVIYFTLFILTSISSRNSDKLSRKMKSLTRAINLSFLFGALLIVVTGILFNFHLYFPAVLIFVLYYMLENIKRPMNVGYISELISSRVMATGLSGESQLKALFVAVLAPLMGFLADKIGVGGGFIVFAALLVCSFPLIAVGRKSNHEG